jgi:heme-degrading monooxygenase HmoA
MIVATSYVSVASPEAGDAFAAAMATRTRAVDSFPGFIRYEFRRELGKRPRYVVITWWETREDLHRYLASPEHRSTHERLPEGVRAGLGPPHVELHEVLEVADGA